MRNFTARIVFTFASLLFVAGCYSQPDRVKRPDIDLDSIGREDAEKAAQADPAEEEKEAEPVEVLSGEQAWITNDQLPWESSFLQYLNGVRVGYTQFSILPPALESSRQVTIRRNDSIEFTRAGQTSRIKVSLESQETADGRMLDFVETTINGRQTMVTKARLSRGVLRLSTTVGEETKTESVKIPFGTWGVMGIQALLMQDPMQPGDKRTAKVYVPSLRKVVNVNLVAGEPEDTALLEGQRAELLPIEVTQMIDETNGSQSINWVNEKGEIQKTVTLTGTALSWFRATPDALQRIEDQYTLTDDNTPSYAPLAGDTSLLADADSITYMVDGDGVDPYEVIPASSGQSTKSITARRTAVISGTSGESKSQSESDSATFLEATPTIESKFKPLADLADEWAGDAASPQAIASRLTKALHREFEHEPKIDAYAATVELLAEKSGNSLEHAGLLAAMLRHKAIPARVASGMLASAKDKRVHLHAWTEALIDGKWVGLDGMLGTLTGPSHIKLTDSAMASKNPFEPVVAAVNLLPKLRIAISTSE